MKVKNVNHKLFEKFEDQKILDETSSKVFGGLTHSWSDQTGDSQCTTAGGGDCADFVDGETRINQDGYYTGDPCSIT